MASVVTPEEIEKLRRKLERMRETVGGDREKARRVLQAAGIVNADGQLAEPYRDTPSE